MGSKDRLGNNLRQLNVQDPSGLMTRTSGRGVSFRVGGLHLFFFFFYLFLKEMFVIAVLFRRVGLTLSVPNVLKCVCDKPDTGLHHQAVHLYACRSRPPRGDACSLLCVVYDAAVARSCCQRASHVC